MTCNAVRVQRLMKGLACLYLVVGLNGCHRKQPPPALPVVVQAPEVPPPPAPASPKMPSPPPASVTSAPPVKVTQAKPKRKPKKSVAKTPAADTAAPVETASALQPEASAIGELSAGGDSTPQRQQETSALIVASEQRLNALPPSTTGPQQAQIRKVRYFLKQARQALSTGDAEGATTLATKARLLIDDLTKQ